MDRTKILDELVGSRAFRGTSLRLVDRVIDLATEKQTGSVLDGDVAFLIATGDTLRLIDASATRPSGRDPLVAPGEIVWRWDLDGHGILDLDRSIKVVAASEGSVPTTYRFVTVSLLKTLSDIWPDFRPLDRLPDLRLVAKRGAQQRQPAASKDSSPWISVLIKVDGDAAGLRSAAKTAHMGACLLRAVACVETAPQEEGRSEGARGRRPYEKAVLAVIDAAKVKLSHWDDAAQLQHKVVKVKFGGGNSPKEVRRRIEAAADLLSKGTEPDQRLLFYVFHDEKGNLANELTGTFGSFGGVVFFGDGSEGRFDALAGGLGQVVDAKGWLMPTLVPAAVPGPPEFETRVALEDESDECSAANSVGRVATAPWDGRLLRRNACRLAFDPRTMTAPPSAQQMESLSRWLRAILFRRVGIALSGGGASAFRFTPLLFRLLGADPHDGREQGPTTPLVPIDIVSGVSGGALVAAYLCADGAAGLASCLRQGREFQRYANLAPFAPQLFERCIDRALGGRRVEDLEMRFVAQTTALWGEKIDKPQAHVVTRGTLGQAVRVSGALPIAFGPADFNDVRYGDGALSANVPARLLKEHGADVAIAINAVPKPRSPVGPGSGLLRIGGRLLSALVGLHNLLDRAQDADRRVADLFFETCSDTEGFLLEASFFGGAEAIARDEEDRYGARWSERALLCRQCYERDKKE